MQQNIQYLTPNKSMQNAEITLYESLPAEFSITNFEAIRIKLNEGLSAISFSMTPENFEQEKKNAKTTMANLNKLAKKFEERTDELLKPLQDRIDEGTTYSKMLKKMILDKRTEIDIQVERFESIKKEECYNLLQARKLELYEQYHIEEEFQTITKERLVAFVILGNITGAGRLSASGERAINELVLLCLKTQAKIKARLQKLAEISVTNGFDFVIQKADVELFLNEPIDEIYEQKLNQYITREKEKIEKRKADELQRQKEAEEKAERIKKDVEDRHQDELKRMQAEEKRKRLEAEEKARIDERQRVESERNAVSVSERSCLQSEMKSKVQETQQVTIAKTPINTNAEHDFFSVNIVLKLLKCTDIEWVKSKAEPRAMELFPKSFCSVKVERVS